MDMKKLFESNIKVIATGASDAKIIFTEVPYIQYEQFKLKNNFKQYVKTILSFRKILNMEIQETLLPKTYEINIGSHSFDVDFLVANRQIDWLEISLTFDKSDRHSKIYDSYSVEKAAVFIKSIEIENISEAYSFTNQMKYDTSNKTQKSMLHKQSVAWKCDGCPIAQLTDYKTHPIFTTADRRR